MKFFATIFFTVLCATSIYAQPKIHIGINTGFNSTYVLDKGLNKDPQYISQTSFKWAPVGVSFGVDFTKRFGLQFESISAAQGQIYQMVETAQNVQNMIAERNIDMSVIQLPLLMKMMSGSDKAARFNFQLGPQLSILNSGMETIKFIEDGTFNFGEGGDIPIDATTVLVQNQADIPDAYLQALASGEIEPPSGNEMEIPLEYFENIDNPGEFDMPQDAVMTLMNSEATSAIQKFKDKEVQLAFGFGFDFDVWKHFYISTNIRGTYSFTDMRNEDLLNSIIDQDIKSIFSNRANLLVGAQISMHWVIVGNRSTRAKKKAEKFKDDPFNFD